MVFTENNVAQLLNKYINAKTELAQVLEEYPLPQMNFPPLHRSLACTSLPYRSTTVYDLAQYNKHNEPEYTFVCNFMKQEKAQEEVRRYAFWLRTISKIQTAHANGMDAETILSTQHLTPFHKYEDYITVYECCVVLGINIHINNDTRMDSCLEIIKAICQTPRFDAGVLEEY